VPQIMTGLKSAETECDRFSATIRAVCGLVMRGHAFVLPAANYSRHYYIALSWPWTGLGSKSTWIGWASRSKGRQAAGFFETLVPFHQTTRLRFPEDNNV
jgi:hypothetical protein